MSSCAPEKLLAYEKSVISNVVEAAPATSSRNLGMENLHIDPFKAALHHNASKNKQKVEVSESWEDEELDSGNQTPTEAPGPSLKPVTSNDFPPGPPPPTPISPSMSSSYDWSHANVLGGGRPRPKNDSGTGTPRSFEDSDTERRRPETTTAAAGRMIAASLGMKAPKKTDEQRQYDRAVKEKEMKRRNREKEEHERERQDDEKAKAAVWDG